MRTAACASDGAATCAEATRHAPGCDAPRRWRRCAARTRRSGDGRVSLRVRPRVLSRHGAELLPRSVLAAFAHAHPVVVRAHRRHEPRARAAYAAGPRTLLDAHRARRG